jgi:heptosyltransferase-3
MKLLFITSNRIGDAVLSTGLLSHLIEQAAAAGAPARATIAVGPAAAPLFGAVPGLERVVMLRKKRFSGHWLDLWRRTALTRWDVVVDLRRSALSYLLWAGARLVVRKPDAPIHRVRLLGELVGRADNPPTPHLWTLQPHRDNAARLLPADRPVLALGPTANWPGKVWPAERFAETARRLTAPDGPLPGAAVAVFGGPAERLQAAPVLREIPRADRIDLVGRVDLLTAAACLGRAALFVGNDSGLMHMAAAMGAPTLGLFGPSRPALYAPWGPRAAFVRTPESFETLTGAPGYDHRTTGGLMGGLQVESVAAAARTLLRTAPSQAPTAARGAGE